MPPTHLEIYHHPYIGGAFYTAGFELFLSKEFYPVIDLYNESLTDRWRTNELLLCPGVWHEGRGYPPQISRKRRGKTFDTLYRRYPDTVCHSVVSSRVESSKIGTEYALIGRTAELRVDRIEAVAFLGTWWEETAPFFTQDYRSVFLDVFRISQQRRAVDAGFLQLYGKFCLNEIMPYARGGPHSTLHMGPHRTPLLDRVVSSQHDGELSAIDPGPWDGRPYNLYWANLIRRSVASRIDLEGYLVTEIGLERVDLTDGIPPQACMGTLDDDYLFFCLSGDIDDSIRPSKKYRDQYNTILDYMLEKDFIYPGSY